MEAVISRRYTPIQTLGRMVVFDGEKVRLQVLTLELPWNNNQKSFSCIPEGKYEVSKIYSPKFGKCFLLNNVPNRSAIEIHKGNYASLTGVSDTSGCILPGMAFEDINDDGTLDIIQSGHALTKMLNILPDTFNLYII